MKKYLMPLAAGFVLTAMAACGNEEKKTETSTPPPAQSQTTPPPAQKTEVSVGPDGASVKTKDGTKVSVDAKGAEVGDKKTDVKIKTPQ